MSEKHMPTMETVEAAWDAMGDGRFVAWLASHEAKIREQTLAPFVKMVDDMREAVASDVLIFGEGEYPVSFFADKLQECIDKTDAVLTLADDRAKLQDRIEELEKNLSYEVEQKIKLADTLRDERAKRPDREQIDRIQSEIDNVHQIHGDTCLCGFKSSRSRSRTEHLTALFAEAVLALEPEAREEKPPVYLASDLWSALRLPDAEFDGYYERNGWADTWSNLLAEVRLRSGARSCGEDADGEPCVLMTESHLVHYGASDVGSSEPLPAPEAREVTDAEVEAAWASLSRSSHRWPDISDMRAALEAAREVSGG